MTRPIADLGVPLTTLQRELRVLVARQRQQAIDEAAPTVNCRCDEPDADPYACEADNCTGEFSELNPFGGGPVHGHDAKVSRTCGCGFRTSVWHVNDGSAEEELHGHVVRVHGGVYPEADRSAERLDAVLAPTHTTPEEAS